MTPEQQRALLRRLKALEDRAVHYRRGTVTATAPLSVALGGSAVAYTACRRLASYAPTIGDTVAVLTFGNDLLVLGKVV